MLTVIITIVGLVWFARSWGGLRSGPAMALVVAAGLLFGVVLAMAIDEATCQRQTVKVLEKDVADPPAGMMEMNYHDCRSGRLIYTDHLVCLGDNEDVNLVIKAGPVELPRQLIIYETRSTAGLWGNPFGLPLYFHRRYELVKTLKQLDSPQ